MIVNPKTLEKGLNTLFMKEYQAVTPWAMNLAVIVPSTANQEDYGWLGSAPALREFGDARVPRGLEDHEYTLVNKKFEATLGIDEDAFEDDQYGGLNVRVADMARRAKAHPNSLLTTLIDQGDAQLCYDGQYFFDTDHEEGASSTQDNDLTASVADTSDLTDAEARALIYQAQNAMLSYVDDRGEPLVEDGIQFTAQNFTVMGTTTHREVFQTAFNSALISNTDNVLKNTGMYLANPRLSSDTELYFMYTGGVLKPFIWQQRRGVRNRVQGGESYTGFMTGQLYYGIDVRYNCGYGLWQYAVKITIS